MKVNKFNNRGGNYDVLTIVKGEIIAYSIVL